MQGAGSVWAAALLAAIQSFVRLGLLSGVFYAYLRFIVKRKMSYQSVAASAAPACAPLSVMMLVASLSAVNQLQAGLGRGALPEFAAFNCYSCHRNMGLARWRDRNTVSGITPGALRINDSALRLLVTALQPWEPRISASVGRHLDELQRAANADAAAVAPAAKAIRAELAGLRTALRDNPGGKADPDGMLKTVLRGAAAGTYPDYATAEQAAMAVVVLLADAGIASDSNADIDELFRSLDDDAMFDKARFARILRQINSAEGAGR